MDDPTKTATNAGAVNAMAGTPDMAALAGLGQAVQAAGGIDGIVEKLRAGGLGEAVDSWISTGRTSRSTRPSSGRR